MSKLRILAGLLILLTGCTTTPRPHANPQEAHESSNEVTAPVEIEHITESPALAPPPPTVFQPPRVAATNRFVTAWISLPRWSAENRVGVILKIANGAGQTFALRATNGLLILRVNDQVAYWNSLEIHFGFGPQLVGSQLCVHSLDLAKNIEPLLSPFSPPAKTNRVIVIDPGHGGSNLGTRSVFNGAYEKEYTLDWARRLAPLLATNGWTVYLTRTNNTDVSLTDRVAFAEARKADLFVSLHFNAAPSPTNHLESGIETFCVTPTGMYSTLKRDYEDDPVSVFPNNRFDFENMQYAVRVQRFVLKASGARDHGVRRARFMTVLRGQNRPAILVEAGYLSNLREAKRIADPNYRQKLAEAVAAALEERPAAPPKKAAEPTNTPGTNTLSQP